MSDKQGGSDEEPKRLFLTTSDVMNTINKNLAELESPDDSLRPRVELQRRLPDGSTQRADEKDLAAADMQTKFKQAAEQLACLESTEEKIEWAEQQRQEGNKLYVRGNYREAMDVYLTCLVAKTDDTTFSTRVLFPTLNNLAQCALQLKMWFKTEQFCTIALDEYKKIRMQLEKSQNNDKNASAMAKIYFRRGKARRLQGKYKDARSDLEAAKRLLSDKSSQEWRSVEREISLLSKSEFEWKRNEKRQARAMRRVLGSAAGDKSAEPTEKRVDSDHVFQEVRQRRPYSKLRSKPKTEDLHDGDDETQHIHERQSCWRHLLLIIAALAEKALELIGDDETTERIAQ